MHSIDNTLMGQLGNAALEARLNEKPQAEPNAQQKEVSATAQAVISAAVVKPTVTLPIPPEYGVVSLTDARRFVRRVNRVHGSEADALRQKFKSIFFQSGVGAKVEIHWHSTQHILTSMFTTAKQKYVLHKEFSKTVPHLPRGESPTLKKTRDIYTRINHRAQANLANLKANVLVLLPHYYHATKAENVEAILKSGHIEVRQNGPFQGAFVSTQPELCYGDFIFAFDGAQTERRSALLNGFPTGDAYWAGFSKAIPLKKNLVYLIVSKPELREQALKYLSAAGYEQTPVVTLAEAETERALLTELNGRVKIPKEWALEGNVANVAQLQQVIVQRVALPVFDLLEVVKKEAKVIKAYVQEQDRVREQERIKQAEQAHAAYLEQKRLRDLERLQEQFAEQQVAAYQQPVVPVTNQAQAWAQGVSRADAVIARAKETLAKTKPSNKVVVFA